MAVIESKGDGYSLFNGVKLPSLPVWDKETFPYASVWHNVVDAQYEFYVSTTRVVVDGSDSGGEGSSRCRLYTLNTDGTWSGPSKTYNFEMAPLAEYVPVWANTDVINIADNSVYLAASDPIPLDGMNVIEWDGDTTGLESYSTQCYFVSYNTDLDIAKNAVCVQTNGATRVEMMEKGDDGYWALWRNVYYNATPVDDCPLTGIEFRKNASYHVSLFAYYPVATGGKIKWAKLMQIYHLEGFEMAWLAYRRMMGGQQSEVIATLTDGVLYIENAPATLNGNTLEVK